MQNLKGIYKKRSIFIERFYFNEIFQKMICVVSIGSDGISNSKDLGQFVKFQQFSEHSYLDEIEKSELDKLRENIDNSVNLRFDL